jgi:hypothetical protein
MAEWTGLPAAEDGIEGEGRAEGQTQEHEQKQGRELLKPRAFS